MCYLKVNKLIIIFIYLLNVASVKFLFHLCAKIVDGVCEIQTKIRVKFQSSKERNWITQLEDGLIETTLIRS